MSAQMRVAPVPPARVGPMSSSRARAMSFSCYPLTVQELEHRVGGAGMHLSGEKGMSWPHGGGQCDVASGAPASRLSPTSVSEDCGP